MGSTVARWQRLSCLTATSELSPFAAVHRLCVSLRSVSWKKAAKTVTPLIRFWTTMRVHRKAVSDRREAMHQPVKKSEWSLAAVAVILGNLAGVLESTKKLSEAAYAGL